MSSYVCPVLVSVLAISATLLVTMSILHWNYVENNKRKTSKKMIILNHWGKQKPVESDLEKLYVEELIDNKLQRYIYTYTNVCGCPSGILPYERIESSSKQNVAS